MKRFAAKTAAFLLSCLFVVLTSLLFAGCAREAPDAGYSFEKTEGGWTIASAPSDALSLALPSRHEGEPVVAVKESAFYRSEVLQRVTVPASIRTIGAYAFADCTALKSVTFEKGGACAIGDFAFENCTALYKAEYNGSVVSIGRAAFKNCRKLFAVKAGEELTTIEEDAFMNCERLIVKAEKGCTLDGYAASHDLAQSFFDSVYTLYLLIAVIVLFGLGVVAAVFLIEKKRRKKT